MTGIALLDVLCIVSILILPVVCWTRYRHILPVDRPLIYLFSLAFLSEVVAAVLRKVYGSFWVGYNIYELVDALFCIQILFNWGCLRRRKGVFRGLQLFFVLMWLGDVHSFKTLASNSPLFPATYSFILVLMSLERVSAFIEMERKSLLANGRFLVLLCFIGAATFQTLQDIFEWINPPLSEDFYIHLNYINIFNLTLVNIIFMVAIFRLPAHDRFTWANF